MIIFNKLTFFIIILLYIKNIICDACNDTIISDFIDKLKKIPEKDKLNNNQIYMHIKRLNGGIWRTPKIYLTGKCTNGNIILGVESVTLTNLDEENEELSFNLVCEPEWFGIMGDTGEGMELSIWYSINKDKSPIFVKTELTALTIWNKNEPLTFLKSCNYNHSSLTDKVSNSDYHNDIRVSEKIPVIEASIKDIGGVEVNRDLGIYNIVPKNKYDNDCKERKAPPDTIGSAHQPTGPITGIRGDIVKYVECIRFLAGFYPGSKAGTDHLPGK